MIKNICKLSFRSLYGTDTDFTEIIIAKGSGNTLEISDGDTAAGCLFTCRIAAALQEPAFYRRDGLQFRVDLSDGTHILIGNEDIAAFMQTKENLDGASISVEWKYWDAPKFL